MSVCHGVMLLCPLSSSARPHDCPRVARLDSQGIAPLDSDGDRGVDGVGEGVMGGEGEMVLACEAELVDELLGVLTKASGGLHSKGNEMSELSGGDVLVLELLVVGSASGEWSSLDLAQSC